MLADKSISKFYILYESLIKKKIVKNVFYSPITKFRHKKSHK